MLDIFRAEAMETAMQVALDGYHNGGGEGFGVGEETDSLEDAVKGAGWTILHTSYDRADCAPSGLYARSPAGDYYGVFDMHGPFACPAPSPEEAT